jgi:hypothetical protein
MTRARHLQRHLHRSAAVATATGLFALAALGTAAVAFAGQEFSADAVTSAPAAVSAPARPAALPVAAADAIRATKAEAAQVAADQKAAAKAAEQAAKAAKAAEAAKAAAARKAAARAAAARAAAVAKAATAGAKAASAPSAPAGKTITISRYANAPGSQAAIDTCQLVLWSSSPNWLAGHNWCGYQWMAYVKTGTTVVVTSGAAQGTYVVYDHLRLGRQSGAMPSTSADLVLQTCVGSGTGLTFLRRV